MKDLPWYGHIVIALIIFGMFFLFYYKPRNEDLANLRAEREEAEREVMRLERKKAELDQIEKDIKTMDLQLQELETMIPHKEEIDVILRRIQQLAQDSRINIIKFIPQALIDQEFFSEKPISVEITGTYHNLGIFFDRLSKFSRLFNIENFSIKALSTQTDASTISASSTAKTYIFKETVPPPKESIKTAGKNE